MWGNISIFELCEIFVVFCVFNVRKFIVFFFFWRGCWVEFRKVGSSSNTLQVVFSVKQGLLISFCFFFILPKKKGQALVHCNSAIRSSLFIRSYKRVELQKWKHVLTFYRTKFWHTAILQFGDRYYSSLQMDRIYKNGSVF